MTHLSLIRINSATDKRQSKVLEHLVFLFMFWDKQRVRESEKTATEVARLAPGDLC